MELSSPKKRMIQEFCKAQVFEDKLVSFAHLSFCFCSAVKYEKH